VRQNRPDRSHAPRVSFRRVVWLLLGTIAIFTPSLIELQSVTEAAISLERLAAFFCYWSYVLSRLTAQGDCFELVRFASDLKRSSALSSLSWASMVFLWSVKRSYSACNSASVIPAKEGSRAFRRAPRVSARIHARILGPMPGSWSQWESGRLATSRMDG
jgi:hypothetical protein